MKNILNILLTGLIFTSCVNERLEEETKITPVPQSTQESRFLEDSIVDVGELNDENDFTYNIKIADEDNGVNGELEEGIRYSVMGTTVLASVSIDNNFENIVYKLKEAKLASFLDKSELSDKIEIYKTDEITGKVVSRFFVDVNGTVLVEETEITPVDPINPVDPIDPVSGRVTAEGTFVAEDAEQYLDLCTSYAAEQGSALEAVYKHNRRWPAKDRAACSLSSCYGMAKDGKKFETAEKIYKRQGVRHNDEKLERLCYDSSKSVSLNTQIVNLDKDFLKDGLLKIDLDESMDKIIDYTASSDFFTEITSGKDANSALTTIVTNERFVVRDSMIKNITMNYEVLNYENLQADVYVHDSIAIQFKRTSDESVAHEIIVNLVFRSQGDNSYILRDEINVDASYNKYKAFGHGRKIEDIVGEKVKITDLATSLKGYTVEEIECVAIDWDNKEYEFTVNPAGEHLSIGGFPDREALSKFDFKKWGNRRVKVECRSGLFENEDGQTLEIHGDYPLQFKFD